MLTIKKLHKEFPTRVVEWGLCYILLTWCLSLVIWPAMMLSADHDIGAGWLAIMPQPIWALLGLAIALVRVTALYINGIHHRTPTVRAAMGFLSMGFWFSVTVGVLQSGYVGPVLAIYPWLMVADGYSIYVATGDMFQAKQIRKLRKAESGRS